MSHLPRAGRLCARPDHASVRLRPTVHRPHDIPDAAMRHAERAPRSASGVFTFPFRRLRLSSTAARGVAEGRGIGRHSPAEMDDDSGEARRPERFKGEKRRQVVTACAPCRISHRCCDEPRPCKRCKVLAALWQIHVTWNNACHAAPRPHLLAWRDAADRGAHSRGQKAAPE